MWMSKLSRLSGFANPQLSLHTSTGLLMTVVIRSLFVGFSKSRQGRILSPVQMIYWVGSTAFWNLYLRQARNPFRMSGPAG